MLATAPIGSAKRSWWRSLAKSMTWRLFATLDTFVVSMLVTGNPKWAGSIVSVELLTKMTLYFVHERVWARASIGMGGAHCRATAIHRRPAHDPFPR